MDNPQGTQDEEKQNKNAKQYVLDNVRKQTDNVNYKT